MRHWGFVNRLRITLPAMEIEWDAAKDRANRAKHGIGLGAAARLDWTRARIEPDHRFDYSESRMIALAPLDGRLHVCVYVLRNDRIRIISLRKANSRERRRHDPNATDTRTS